MMPERLRAISVSPDVTIRKALETIGNAVNVGAPVGMVLIVAPDDKLLGIVTDGDVRRGLLRGASLDDPVDTIAVHDPVTLPASLPASRLVSRIRGEASRRTRLRESKVDKLILTDDNGVAVDIVSYSDLWYLSPASTRTVAVIGLGFVGLTLAVTLADAGLQVVGVEANEKTLSLLRTGKAHFHELGLDPLLKYHVERERLTLVSSVDEVAADIFIVSVGTPIDDATLQPDLKDVEQAVRAIGKRVRRRGLVVLRSTVPVGTCRKFVAPILEEESGLKLGRDLFLAFAPERTIEGKALEELRTLPQIVGGWDTASKAMAASLMREITPTIVEVDTLEAAEMIKLVNNSFRDLSFAFANQLALVCDHWNLDAAELVRAANDGYPRNRVPVPSPGVGGICLTKDPLIYAAVASEAGISAPLSSMGRQVNQTMPGYVARRIIGFLAKNGIRSSDAKVVIAGLAFKGRPETSDIRKSTAIDTLKILLDEGVNVWGYDAVVDQETIESVGAHHCPTMESAFKDADVVAVLNNHEAFTKIDIYETIGSMHRPGLFFDGWHMFVPEDVARIDGITYASLGHQRDGVDDESAEAVKAHPVT